MNMYKEKVKIKRTGVNGKRKTSKNKNSKLYKKPLVGQGRKR
jgi:hypothetical protein